MAFSEEQQDLADINTLARWVLCETAQRNLKPDTRVPEGLPNIDLICWAEIEKQVNTLMEWFKPSDVDKDAAYTRLSNRTEKQPDA